MFEIDARGGLGRRGTWTRSGRTLPTPLVLFLHRSSRPAPTYAEALFVSERSEDPRFQVRVSGSFFAPRSGNHADDLPPVKGMPLSMADLEIPEDGVAGELSILGGGADLTEAPGADGRLRELVERRLANAPWNTAVVRHLDLREYDWVEPYTAVAGGAMLAYSHESLHRPEIVRFRRRIRDRYRKPPSLRVLLLLPCSARKPHSARRSHPRVRRPVLCDGNPALVPGVHLTPPLG